MTDELTLARRAAFDIATASLSHFGVYYLRSAGSPTHGAISPQSEMVPTAATHGWLSSCAPSAATPVMAGTFAPDEPQAAPTR